MRWLLILYTFTCYLFGSAQVIKNPVFDRTDTISFRVKMVELTKDTTYLYCSLSVEPGSWANISKDTYLYDVKSGNKYPLLKSIGLPYSPRQKIFYNYDKCIITLCFPPIGSTSKFDLIESQEDKAFNVYGINIDTIPFGLEFKEHEVSRTIRQRDFYSNIENYEKAIFLTEQIIDGCKFLYGINSEAVFLSLANLSYYYHYLGNNYKAIDCLNKALNVANRIPNYNVDKIEEYISILSIYYNDIGDYQKAIDILSSTMEQVINKYGENSLEYSEILIKLSKYSNNLGIFSQALQYAEQAGKIIKTISGEQNDSYIRCLSNFATAKSNLGNYDEAIDANLKCYSINSKITDKFNIANALFMGNISYNYGMLGKYEEAIKFGVKSCELYSVNNVENDDYVGFLSNISHYYFMNSSLLDIKKDYLLINEYLAKCLIYSDSAEHVAKRLNSSSLSLTNLYNNKASILSLQGKMQDAISFQKKACELSHKTSLDYPVFLQNLGLLYLFSGNFKDAIKIETESIKIFDSRIKRNLQSLSNLYISNYWSAINYWYNNFIPKCAFYTQDKDALTYLYDKTALFAKGFLLNANIYIQDLLRKDNNVTNQKILKDIQILYYKLDSLSNIEINSAEILKLENEIKEKENVLASKSSSYKEYLSKMNCQWQTVHNKLKDTDVAIEFLKCPLGLTNDSVVYAALILKKEFSSPMLIPLFNENKINDPKLRKINFYNLIWSPLEKLLDNVKTIYFSPSGVINNIAIEYLYCNKKNKYMHEEFDIYRLSSTMEIVSKKGTRGLHKAALFGGINYDTTETNDVIINNTDETEFPNRGLKNNSVIRNGFSELPNTIIEINNIAEIMKNKRIIPLLFYSTSGSEHNFKMLSKNNIDLLHIATHGKYINYETAEKQIVDNNFKFISMNKSCDISGESLALTRSFLVMAGGNRLPYRIEIPNNGNDGILTALEISRLDLHNVDLVVLSACQTGLGDISNEGILGLQRGFKKAGANTILMSLDKVDDEATKILMVEFYRNLMNGKTKRQSLQEAQKYLRKVDNGKYDDPKYWASFIMLDGLN